MAGQARDSDPVQMHLISGRRTFTEMKIIDLHDPQRVNRKPDGIEILLKSGSLDYEGFSINAVEMRHYIEKKDDKLGYYSLITSYVETDKGSVEMVYDEGFRGDDHLSRTVKFLVSTLGISGLILRSVITLREQLRKEAK